MSFSLPHLSREERALIEQAIRLASEAHRGQTRSDGSPYMTHVLAVASILGEWHADGETIIAGLLHDTVEDTSLTLNEIKVVFGRNVTALVEGVTKFTQADFEGEPTLDRKIETLRKLFEVMRRDIRVVIIKLADRLHNMRTLEALPPERRLKFARETMAIYYKLSYHLGMNALRREFSERCIPVLFPQEALDMRRLREKAEKTGREVQKLMEKELRMRDDGGALRALELHSRSFYSMQRERKSKGAIRQGFFLTAVARDTNACYVLLRLVHSLFRPVSGEFHDHIAAPTESAYRAIRTGVLGPGNDLVLLRICTREMQEQEELGVLLLCFGKKELDLPGFSWLTRSAELDLSTRESSEAFWEALQSDIFQETVSIVVDGRVIHLPRRATVLDALYARHGAEAHLASTAQMNGASVSLSDSLSEDAVIQATLETTPCVSFEWLGAIETAYARQLIVAALKERDKSEKLLLGQRLLQKELDRYRKGALAELSRHRLRDTAEHFHRAEFEEVLALIGEGVIQARDVVFFLHPEQRSRIALFRGKKRAVQQFQLQLTGVEAETQDILPKVHALTRLSDVEIGKTDLRTHPGSKTFDLFVSGTTLDRLHLGDFLSLLERQSWISRIRMLLSRRQKAFLITSFSTAFGIILLDILLLPSYPKWLPVLSFLPFFLLQALPLLPILAVNYYMLRLLRHHVVRMRTDRWFLGVACLLNIVGLLLIILRGVLREGMQQSLLPLLAIVVVSMLYVAYKFFQTEMLFKPLDELRARHLSRREWHAIQRKKTVGYAIRLCAVCIWGLEPIYIRYTPANDVSPFLRTSLLSIGVLLPSGLFFLVRRLVQKKRIGNLRLPYEGFFLCLIIGQTGLMYFKNASLLYTSGTNMLLFSNFAPVIGLLIAATFWRRRIPYLRQPRHMLWIFLLAVLSGVGSSLLLLNSLVGASRTILGDLLAMIAVFFDVLLTVGQIEYLKKFPKTDGALLNLHIFTVLLLFTAPAVLVMHLLGFSILRNASSIGLLLSIGIGLFVGFGQMLNYEAFKRIDGYLAFMMFNFSVLLTFILEVFAIHAVQPTALLLLSGIFIVGASVGAELINSRCQKRGA